MILFCCLLSMTIGLFVADYLSPPVSVSSGTFSLVFPGVENRQYPDGTAFSPDQLIRPELQGKVNADLNREFKTGKFEHVSLYLNVDSIIPFKVQEKILQAKKEKKDFEFIPTTFTLNFITPLSSAFSDQEKEKYIYMLQDYFKDEFKKRFEQEVIAPLNLNDNLTKNADYSEQISLQKMAVASMLKNIDKVLARADYISPSSGLSFSYIRNNLVFIAEVMLPKISANVEMLKITRDKGMFLNGLNFQLESVNREIVKKTREAEIAEQLLNKIIDSKEPAVSPAVPDNKSKELLATSITLDKGLIDQLKNNDIKTMLLNLVINAKNAVAALRTDADFLQQKINAVAAAKNNNNAETEIMLRQVGEKIIKLGNLANALNEENNRRIYSSIVQINEAPNSYLSCKIFLLIVAGFTVLPLLITFLLVGFGYMAETADIKISRR